MHFIFYILPTLFIIPVSIYMYIYLRRVAKYFSFNITSKKICAIIFIIAFMLSMPLSNIWGVWTVVILHFVFFSILLDIIYYICHKKWNLKKVMKGLYQCGIIPIICTSLVIGYGYWNMKNIVEKDYTIYTKKNIQQNYRIAFISDLHFGNTMNQKELEKYCEDISKHQPDIVLLGGDIVDERSTHQQMSEAFGTLSSIQNNYGIYYVYGNHDRALYSSAPHFTPKELQETITQSGIKVLSDDIEIINNEFVIAGREDASYNYPNGRMSSADLLSSIHQEYFLLLLDHQPKELHVNDQNGYDLQLSGHTHGGQIFPVGLISDWLGFGEMNYGYQALEHMQVIVSSGIAGWGYPLRTGSQSEYVIVNIENVS